MWQMLFYSFSVSFLPNKFRKFNWKYKSFQYMIWLLYRSELHKQKIWYDFVMSLFFRETKKKTLSHKNGRIVRIARRKHSPSFLVRVRCASVSCVYEQSLVFHSHRRAYDLLCVFRTRKPHEYNRAERERESAKYMIASRNGLSVSVVCNIYTKKKHLSTIPAYVSC